MKTVGMEWNEYKLLTMQSTITGALECSLSLNFMVEFIITLTQVKFRVKNCLYFIILTQKIPLSSNYLGEFSDSFSSDEDLRPSNSLILRDRVLTNAKGFRDFRVKSLKGAAFGRKMISIAEQGGCGCEGPLGGIIWYGCFHYYNLRMDFIILISLGQSMKK